MVYPISLCQNTLYYRIRTDQSPAHRFSINPSAWKRRAASSICSVHKHLHFHKSIGNFRWAEVEHSTAQETKRARERGRERKEQTKTPYEWINGIDKIDHWALHSMYNTTYNLADVCSMCFGHLTTFECNIFIWLFGNCEIYGLTYLVISLAVWRADPLVIARTCLPAGILFSSSVSRPVCRIIYSVSRWNVSTLAIRV